jgi:molybdenum cofactor cytidylyltransferase
VAALEGILLAAGESRRMGYPKPLLKIGGRSFIEHLSRVMLDAIPRPGRLTIVLGAHADRVRKVIPDDPRIIVVHNPDYAAGQLSSLRAGLAGAGPVTGAVLVHLVDHPTVKPETFKSLIEEYGRVQKPIVVASFRGRRGHPVIFGREVFAELLAAPLNRGARAVVDADPTRVRLFDVDDPGVTLDLDTPEDLERAGLPPPPRD